MFTSRVKLKALVSDIYCLHSENSDIKVEQTGKGTLCDAFKSSLYQVNFIAQETWKIPEARVSLKLS